MGGMFANMDNPVGFLFSNFQIQTNLLDAGREVKVERVLFPRSSWISLMPTNLHSLFYDFNLKSIHILPVRLRKSRNAKVNDADSVTVWGIKKSTKESLHVDDATLAVLYCVVNHDADLHLNVGIGIETLIEELARIVKQVVDFEGVSNWATCSPVGTSRNVLDVSRLYAMGWKHNIELEEAINETYGWFDDAFQIAS